MCGCTHTHTHAHVYTRIYPSTCMHSCVCMSIYRYRLCTHENIYTQNIYTPHYLPEYGVCKPCRYRVCIQEIYIHEIHIHLIICLNMMYVCLVTCMYVSTSYANIYRQWYAYISVPCIHILCMHTCVCTPIYRYRVCMPMYRYIDIVYVHTCTRAFVPQRVCLYIDIVYVHTCTRVFIPPHVCIHAYVCLYIDIVYVHTKCIYTKYIYTSLLARISCIYASSHAFMYLYHMPKCIGSGMPIYLYHVYTFRVCVYVHTLYRHIGVCMRIYLHHMTRYIGVYIHFVYAYIFIHYVDMLAYAYMRMYAYLFISCIYTHNQNTPNIFAPYHLPEYAVCPPRDMPVYICVSYA